MMDVIIEGWVGKSKGLFQILYERGWIDPSKPASYYTMDGKKDRFGHVIESSSLKYLSKKLHDFEEEETLLQYHGRLLGAIVIRSPKCHPEFAGEGIEYDWGCSKNFYRRLPILQKKGKETFRDSVRKSTCRNSVLTIKRRRKFSRRAREYMLAYHAFNVVQEQNNATKKQEEARCLLQAPIAVDVRAPTVVGAARKKQSIKHESASSGVKQEEQQPKTNKIIHSQLEKVMKVKKTHRSMRDSDSKFLDDVLDAMER